jgi:hypothetical protein
MPSVRLYPCLAAALCLVTAALVGSIPIALAAQGGCPPIPAGGNISSLDEYAFSESTCTRPQTCPTGVCDVATDKDLKPGGAFVKSFKYVLLDAHALSSGTCQTRVMNGQGGCDLGFLQLRYIVKIVDQHAAPPGAPGTVRNNYPVVPGTNTLDQRYDVDSRVAGTTLLGTWRALLGYEGVN